ncbi:hypothetical protein ABEB36_006697 [Hypothenemus hampei]|uniref:C2H2-type domain-containing protein n=1 Tax=Hypothenemus hampei TaxID=57062 RepID=A0ABD1EVD4_HYPHA
MSSSEALNDQSIVCRTCLKVLDTNGFSFIDDENGYVKNVGNIREMIQFCVPELDLYVSSQPVICYQCLTALVQVYNFKIKCLNGENIIKAYLARNNLQDYNHVNLNCVLMDDLKMKSNKIQIESRIKRMMLKELPEVEEQYSDNLACGLPLSIDELCDKTYENSLDNNIDLDVNSEFEQLNNDLQIEVNGDEISKIKEEICKDEEDIIQNIEQCEESEMQKKALVVRKDLFAKNMISTEPATIINNKIMPQNVGKLLIKINKGKLKPLAVEVNQTESDEINCSLPTTLSSGPTSANTEFSFTPKIVAVETIDETNESQNCVYTCKKCNFTTEDVIKIYDHNRTYHNFDYTCQHCPFSTSKVELLGKHMSMVHPQSLIPKKSNVQFRVTKNYACSLCPFSVKSVDLLRSHIMTAHGQTDSDKSPIILNQAFLTKQEPRILKTLEYTCDVCPYATKDKSNLRKHLFTHGTKPLKCEHCVYKCVSPYQLRRHQKQKHAKQANPRVNGS